MTKWVLVVVLPFLSLPFIPSYIHPCKWPPTNPPILLVPLVFPFCSPSAVMVIVGTPYHQYLLVFCSLPSILILPCLYQSYYMAFLQETAPPHNFTPQLLPSIRFPASLVHNLAFHIATSLVLVAQKKKEKHPVLLCKVVGVRKDIKAVETTRAWGLTILSRISM